MDEFRLIATYFAPLASGVPGARALADDAALLTLPPGKQLVMTTDTMVAGVHFIGNEPPALLAKKLLRVNLSDLAAMGANPYAYLLVMSLPKDTQELWIQDFARGLAEDQSRYGCTLVGGDTTATPGALTLTLTALGWVEAGRALTRSGAAPGDRVYVSGTLGDAALGLEVVQGTRRVTPAQSEFLTARYQLPEPRVALGQALVGLASAAMDISDGLVQDLGHLCRASGVGATIYADQVPLSEAAAPLERRHALEAALTGGDDYELLFTAPPEKEPALVAVARTSGVVITCIGNIRKGEDVRVLDADGSSAFNIKTAGYKHFW